MQKFIVGAIAIIAGIIAIVIGLRNIKTETAQETGRRRTVNRVAGVDSGYTGSRAVMQGRIRMFIGIGAIVFGIGFMIVGSD